MSFRFHHWCRKSEMKIEPALAGWIEKWKHLDQSLGQFEGFACRECGTGATVSDSSFNARLAAISAPIAALSWWIALRAMHSPGFSMGDSPGLGGLLLFLMLMVSTLALVGGSLGFVYQRMRSLWGGVSFRVLADQIVEHSKSRYEHLEAPQGWEKHADVWFFPDTAKPFCESRRVFW